jgi:hypothetical protein
MKFFRKDTVMIYYLPSCKVKANHAEASLKIRQYLNEHGVEIIGCCRVSQNLFKPGDTVLTNCTNCALITDEVSPQANEISLYEYLAEDSSFLWPDFHGEKITVQDCWRARHKPTTQKAVRICLQKMNIIPVELEENFSKTKFCGTWLYSPMKDNNLKIAPNTFNDINDHYVQILDEEEKIRRMKEQVSKYTTSKVAVYCNACEKGARLGGADAVHMVELLASAL